MKELVIGMSIGFIAGVIAVKTCKPISDFASKTKNIIKDKTEEIKK